MILVCLLVSYSASALPADTTKSAYTTDEFDAAILKVRDSAIVKTDTTNFRTFSNSRYAYKNFMNASDGDPDSAVFIDTTGNVGIGIISPDVKLAVNGAYNYYADTSGTNGNVNALGINTDDFGTAELTDGTELTINVNSTNTLAVTFYVNAGTSGGIKKYVTGIQTDLVAGDLVAGRRIKVNYDATNNNFQVMSPLAQ